LWNKRTLLRYRVDPVRWGAVVEYSHVETAMSLKKDECDAVPLA
jgi:hypothetical protein